MSAGNAVPFDNRRPDPTDSGRRAVRWAAAALALCVAVAGCSKASTSPSQAGAAPAGASAAPAAGAAPAGSAATGATGAAGTSNAADGSKSAGAAGTAGAPGAAPAGRPALTVTVTTPRTAALQRTQPATGAVAAWREIAIAPEVGGYLVASVLADVGDVVKKGQTLATLRSDLLAADLASRRAAREQAQASLTNAQSVLRRADTLKDTGAISDEELDRLRTEVLVAQARLQAAQAELSTAQLRLDKARITAPDAGTITSRSVTVGQVAQPSVEMFRLMRQGRLEWRAQVPEVRLGEIKAGQRVVLRTADGTRFEGTVRTIGPTVNAEDRNALVYVDIAAGAPVRPGQFATGEFDLGTSQATTVPLASLVTLDGMQYVFVVDDQGRVHRHHVAIGVSQGDAVEITEGLKPDDRVVVRGAGYLRDGDLVAVAEAPAAGTASAVPRAEASQ